MYCKILNVKNWFLILTFIFRSASELLKLLAGQSESVNILSYDQFETGLKKYTKDLNISAVGLNHGEIMDIARYNNSDTTKIKEVLITLLTCLYPEN